MSDGGIVIGQDWNPARPQHKESTMPTIRFRTKIVARTYTDGTPAPRYVNVPKIMPHHCDMAAFRRHPAFSMYANCDMFSSILARAMRHAGVSTERIMLDQPLPSAVKIDTSGYLVEVAVDVEEWRPSGVKA